MLDDLSPDPPSAPDVPPALASARAPPAPPSAFPATTASRFWTALPFNPALTAAWLVDLGSGFTVFIAATTPSNVRCVR